jgi:arylsulfatase A-like enzyme
VRRAVLTAFLVALGLSAPGAGQEARPSPPNLVIVLVDDLGWSDPGYAGSDFHETPRIDALAREGTVFRHAYGNGPNCAPTRASLLTGQYPPRHGVHTVGSSKRGDPTRRMLVPIANRRELAPEKVTLAEVLKSAGYATGFVGKWQLGEGRKGPHGQGFDLNVGGNRLGVAPSYFSPYRNPDLEDGKKGEYLTDRLTKEAIGFLDRHRERPFFLVVSHFAVHTPIQPPPSLLKKYADRSAADAKKGEWRRHDDAAYAAMIESVDRSVGALVGRIEELGLSDRTVVFFLSDNGGVRDFTSMKPLRGGKGTLYEGGIRIPMVVRGPGRVKAGATCDVPVITVDLFPTLLEIAGVAPPPDGVLDGVSLVPLLEGREIPDRALYWHFPAYLAGNDPDSHDPGWRTTPCGAIRLGDWKLLEYFEAGDVELYDLASDPGETRNVAGDRPEKARELKDRLGKWREGIGAPVPTERNPEYGEREGE